MDQNAVPAVGEFDGVGILKAVIGNAEVEFGKLDVDPVRYKGGSAGNINTNRGIDDRRRREIGGIARELVEDMNVGEPERIEFGPRR